jgi:hypothetical protein
MRITEWLINSSFRIDFNPSENIAWVSPCCSAFLQQFQAKVTFVFGNPSPGSINNPQIVFEHLRTSQELQMN